LLGTWLAAPHVREWWNHDPSPDAVERDFGVSIDGAEPGEDWIAGVASIDYLVGDPDMIGRGLGSAMISAFVAFVWTHDPTTTSLVVPVNSANERSWRALLRAGFRRVARGELDPDNPIHDRLHEVLRIDRPTIGS